MTDEQLQYEAHLLRGRLHQVIEPLLREFGEKTGQAPMVEFEEQWDLNVYAREVGPNRVANLLRHLGVHVGILMNKSGPPSTRIYWATEP